MNWWLALLFRKIADGDHMIRYFLVELRAVFSSELVVYVFLRECNRWVYAFRIVILVVIVAFILFMQLLRVINLLFFLLFFVFLHLILTFLLHVMVSILVVEILPILQMLALVVVQVMIVMLRCFRNMFFYFQFVNAMNVPQNICRLGMTEFHLTVVFNFLCFFHKFKCAGHNSLFGFGHYI
jgi:hypothetical protein